MCEANVYIIDNEGNEELVMDSVDKIYPEKDKIYMKNIFSQRKTVKARIKEMSLVEHKIIIENIEE